MNPTALPNLATITTMSRGYLSRAGFDLETMTYDRALFARIEHTDHEMVVQWAISGPNGLAIHQTRGPAPDDRERWREDTPAATRLLGSLLGDLISEAVLPVDIHELLTVIGLCADEWVAPSRPREGQWTKHSLMNSVPAWAQYRMAGDPTPRAVDTGPTGPRFQYGDLVRMTTEAGRWAGHEGVIIEAEPYGTTGNTQVQIRGIPGWWLAPAEVEPIEHLTEAQG